MKFISNNNVLYKPTFYFVKKYPLNAKHECDLTVDLGHNVGDDV